jgi:lipoprotein-anchoring transpeptidase ErfK/SrfK
MVLEKIVDKRSNRYGKMYDIDGKLINTDADAMTDVIPEGGRFEGAYMKYWMRFTWDGVGHHIGPIPSSRRAVSHGCIRGYYRAMPEVFAKVKVGTRVLIE